MLNQSWKLSGYCFETEQMAAYGEARRREIDRGVLFPTPQGIKARMQVDVQEYLYELKRIVERIKPTVQYPDKEKIQYTIHPDGSFKPDAATSVYINDEVRKSGWRFTMTSDQRDGVWYTLSEL